MSKGLDVNFMQQVAAVDLTDSVPATATAKAGSAKEDDPYSSPVSGQLLLIGQVTGKLVVVPDFDIGIDADAEAAKTETETATRKTGSTAVEEEQEEELDDGFVFDGGTGLF